MNSDSVARLRLAKYRPSLPHSSSETIAEVYDRALSCFCSEDCWVIAAEIWEKEE
jgi:hypothetical protein